MFSGFCLQRTVPAGFIAPCLPIKTDKLPSGSQWLHEIKHDGFRIIARKAGAQVRLYSRPGNDLTRRFPLIVETLARLRSRSCIIDGEAVACDDNGVASFVSISAMDLPDLPGSLEISNERFRMSRHRAMVDARFFPRPKFFSGYRIELAQEHIEVGKHCPHVFKP
jgi:bifunctional non-homologous end joining protein LigD